MRSSYLMVLKKAWEKYIYSTQAYWMMKDSLLKLPLKNLEDFIFEIIDFFTENWSIFCVSSLIVDVDRLWASVYEIFIYFSDYKL